MCKQQMERHTTAVGPRTQPGADPAIKDDGIIPVHHKRVQPVGLKFSYITGCVEKKRSITINGVEYVDAPQIFSNFQLSIQIEWKGTVLTNGGLRTTMSHSIEAIFFDMNSHTAVRNNRDALR